MASLSQQMAASRDRVVAKCPEAIDPNSEVGQAISEVIDDLQGSNILNRPNAAEEVFAQALERLTPATKTRILGEIAAKTAPAPIPPVTVAPAQLSPHTDPPILPVSPSARTSSQSPLISGPATLRQTLPEVATETLEASLYGDTGQNEPVYRVRR